MRSLVSLLLVSVLLCTTARGGEALVFVSALAAAEKGGIYAYQFDTNSGALKPLHQTTDVKMPFFLAVSPDRNFLYAVDVEKAAGKSEEFVAAYAIQGRTGELKQLNRQPSRGTTTCYLDVDPSGKTVTLANYSTGSVAALPVKADGSLAEAASFIEHSGSGADPKRQKGPNAHSIVISPDGRFALAADLGIDKIMIYRLDAATAKLTPNEAQPFAALPPGSGPRHITFHPNGRRVYVINELKNTIAFFDYAPETGSLTERQTISTLPGDFTGKSYTADLKITPDGRFLYGTNRGHDSIASYRIAEDGKLTLVGLEPSLGKGPQNLLITPDGRWLLCANMPGNSLVVFQIDAATGKIKPTGEPTATPMPSCIRLVPE
jgi:6-phosphogluconolactonase